MHTWLAYIRYVTWYSSVIMWFTCPRGHRKMWIDFANESALDLHSNGLNFNRRTWETATQHDHPTRKIQASTDRTIQRLKLIGKDNFGVYQTASVEKYECGPGIANESWLKATHLNQQICDKHENIATLLLINSNRIHRELVIELLTDGHCLLENWICSLKHY